MSATRHGVESPFQLLVPGPPLDRFIALLWYAETSALAHPRERVLPYGAVDWLINLDSAPLPRLDAAGRRCGSHRAGILQGACSRPTLIDTSRPAWLLAVHFKPGGAFPFLPMPQSELLDSGCGLELLGARDVERLRERAAEAPDAAARFALLEDFLRARLLRPLALHPAVDFALAELDRDPNRALDAIVARSGWSARRFRQVFRQQVGLPPKLYARIMRFQRLLRSAFGRPRVDWTRLALAAGYSDQAHCIRDFRGFTGMTPGAWRRAAPTNLQHVPVGA